jgi:hypothetical protein
MTNGTYGFCFLFRFSGEELWLTLTNAERSVLT